MGRVLVRCVCEYCQVCNIGNEINGMCISVKIYSVVQMRRVSVPTIGLKFL